MFSLLLLTSSHKWKILNKSNDALLDCFKNCWTSWQTFNSSSLPVTLTASLRVRGGIAEHSCCTHCPRFLRARWPAGSASPSVALSTRPWDWPCPRGESTAYLFIFWINKFSSPIIPPALPVRAVPGPLVSELSSTKQQGDGTSHHHRVQHWEGFWFTAGQLSRLEPRFSLPAYYCQMSSK